MRVSTFGELLRGRRRATGLTQAELAERAGLSERAISDMERGLKTPHPATLRLLAKALTLSDTELREWQAARQERIPGVDGAGANPSFGHLPAARTSFVGREQLLATVCALLGSAGDHNCLLTLTGPGGTGKTRLAVEAADALREQYIDGVYFVGLAAITDPRLVASTITQAFGLAQDGRLSPLEGLKRHLSDRHLLLILDNFEQVLGAAVDIAELVAACSRLRVVVTSRAPLRVLAERELTVPPLELPSSSDAGADAAAACESVTLFVERARAVDASFVLTQDNAWAIVDICRRVDGLPLAIELAAARTRLLDPSAMLARLERRLHFLTDGAQDAPARQQTLRNTITWSYDLLEAQEQAMFRRLAVFVGGFSLEAAHSLCVPAVVDNADAVFDVVESLLAKNLLRRATAGPGEVRVSMLETIREFGLESLAWDGELEAVRRQHAEYFLTLAESAAPEFGGPAARGWLDRLELEHDNLRAALEWSLTNPSQGGEISLRIAAALGRFWWLRGHFDEGRRWLNRALTVATGSASVTMAALHAAGWLAHFQHESAAARTLLQRGLSIARQLQDGWWQAWVLHALGRVAYFEYDASAARQFAEQSLAIAQELSDRWLIAWALHLLGLAAYIAGDYTTAATYYEECLAIRRELGHLEGIAIALHIKGILAERRGDFRAALKLYREALQVARELNASWLVSTILPHFATLAAEHQPTRAARLGGAVTLMVEQRLGLPIPLTQALFDDGMQLARRKLGQAAFAAAWAEGRAMSLEAAIYEAQAVQIPAHASSASHLTAAEVEVLRRLASGRTTREIAAELVISGSTVDRHITHIYQKIGRRGRAAAAAFALESGLLQCADVPQQ
jgi:predicted ATPase/DNA-binding CsgD family transcriptional regulator